MSQQTIFKQIGGFPTFERLVNDFYSRVEADPELRPVFPAELEEGKRAQMLFLAQYFGGPDVYSQERGHPRLRMRHAPFTIGQHERDLWLGHMLAAIDAVGIAEPARTEMREYFSRAATFMINKVEPGHPSLKVIKNS
jgi:hemoglobin